MRLRDLTAGEPHGPGLTAAVRGGLGQVADVGADGDGADARSV
jgi:hypothetical protein